MKAALGMVALAALGSLVLAAEQQVPPRAEAAPAVAMVELTLDDGTAVTGRLVREDDQTVQVTSFAGSSIGYGRGHIQSVRHYSLPAAEFAERTGDYQAGQLWKASDGPGTYMKARDQYAQALLLTAAAEDRRRVEAKLTALERERDALQAEALRRTEEQKAADEADAVRLQKLLTQQQIAAVQALGPRMQQLEQGLRQTNQAILALQNAANGTAGAMDDLARQIAAVRDELTTLEYNVVYIPYPVFPDHRRPREDGSHRDEDRDAPRP